LSIFKSVAYFSNSLVQIA